MVAQIPVLQTSFPSHPTPVAYASAVRHSRFLAAPSAFRWAAPARRSSSLGARTSMRDFLNEHYA